MKWPTKQQQQKQRRAREHARDRLECMMSHLSDEALDLLDSIGTLSAWNQDRARPLVAKVDAELETAAAKADGELTLRSRERPRLPAPAAVDDGTVTDMYPIQLGSTEQIAATRAHAVAVLNKALGIEVPEPEPEPEPERPRLSASLRHKLRRHRKPRRQTAAEPEGKHHTPAARKHSRHSKSPHTDSAAASSETPAPQHEQPAKPVHNPWINDESVWS